ncbi:hypothetical protein JHL21_13545 [Devosia sp. WQ 349]|uniref:hypothetical protein n=1 Tax=Devosia sp. WQ 349K1 TaxID=2800329 RepID=UPI001902CF90|nr:hypothetical protein [Devosia sp. WQ 349K1]MBK1795522.1 hypothetical protein [Devosia sp. WQ 349K1]
MALLNQLTITLIFTRLLGALVVIGVHGFLLAACLRLLGDKTAQYTGRLTPNPASHASLLALVTALVAQMLWINPIKIRPENLRWGRWSLVLAAFCALLGTLAIVPSLYMLHPLVLASAPRGLALSIVNTLVHVADMAVWFVALNWLPIPLMTGSLLAFAVFPSLHDHFARLQDLFKGLLVVLIIAGVLDPAIRPIHDWIAAQVIR